MKEIVNEEKNSYSDTDQLVPIHLKPVVLYDRIYLYCADDHTDTLFHMPEFQAHYKDKGTDAVEYHISCCVQRGALIFHHHLSIGWE